MEPVVVDYVKELLSEREAVLEKDGRVKLGLLQAARTVIGSHTVPKTGLRKKERYIGEMQGSRRRLDELVALRQKTSVEKEKEHKRIDEDIEECFSGLERLSQGIERVVSEADLGEVQALRADLQSSMKTFETQHAEAMEAHKETQRLLKLVLDRNTKEEAKIVPLTVKEAKRLLPTLVKGLVAFGRHQHPTLSVMPTASGGATAFSATFVLSQLNGPTELQDRAQITLREVVRLVRARRRHSTLRPRTRHPGSQALRQ
jgi:hypothetical protein